MLGETSAAFVETWISLPKNRRPKSWDEIEDPVCLERNLYGHPLGGMLWEKHCEKAVFAAGFTKIKGWECLYIHAEKQLLLSIYVDDFKMAGSSRHPGSMWETFEGDS